MYTTAHYKRRKVDSSGFLNAVTIVVTGCLKMTKDTIFVVLRLCLAEHMKRFGTRSTYFVLNLQIMSLLCKGDILTCFYVLSCRQFSIEKLNQCRSTSGGLKLD